MDDVICPPLSISCIVVSLWLAGCLAKSTVIGWRKYYGRGGVGVDKHLCGAQQTRGFDLVLFQYWPTATALDRHWNNIRSSPCLCRENCRHLDTRVPSVSGWNRLHRALCTFMCSWLDHVAWINVYFYTLAKNRVNYYLKKQQLISIILSTFKFVKCSFFVCIELWQLPSRKIWEVVPMLF